MSEPLGAWRAGLRIAAFRWHRYVPGGALWALEHALPLVTGLLLKAIFDRVTGDQPAYASGLALLAVLVAAEAAQAGTLWAALVSWPGWWQVVAAWLRANLLGSLLLAPGPPSERLPASTGEAVGRFRDDVEDLIWYVDIWVDIAGASVFTAAALVVMLSISPVVTLVALLPLAGVLLGSRVLRQVVRRSHLRQREQGSSVTDLIADLFAGVLALQVAGAEDRALARLRDRNASRGRAAVRAQLARDLLETVSLASARVSTGLVLLLAASAMRQGTFTVGDLALFSTYAITLTELPRWLGKASALQREAGVALDRLARLHPDRRRAQVVEVRPESPTGPSAPMHPIHAVAASAPRLRINGYARSGAPRRRRGRGTWPPNASAGFPAAPLAPPALPAARPDEGLRSLEVRGLTARHQTSGGGIVGADLHVEPGSLTVLAGAIGSGKSTLIRALLGLIPVESGTILWNGVPVEDPGAFLVPPRVAYAGQVPRLFSATLEENLRLGWPVPDDGLRAALGLAQLRDEVAEMRLGLGTVIGSRGSRLSGGQAQRAAIARALVRAPDLLVLDDISSALDGRTEERVWEGIREERLTCLAASNRAAALERADRIVVLDAGRVVAAGTLDRLAGECPEFRRLWCAEREFPDAAHPLHRR